MTAQTKIGGVLRSFIDNTMLRWIMPSLVVLMVVGTAAYSYRKFDNELTAVALSRREAVAQLMAATLTEKFGRVVDVAISLSTHARFRNLITEKKWGEAIEILHDTPSNFPHIEQLFLTDTGGSLQAAFPALTGVAASHFTSRSWLEGVRRHWQAYVSPVFMQPGETQLNYFSVAVPVKSTDGNVVGILVLQIRVESLLGQLSGIHTGAETLAYIIVDSNGQMAFHSRQRQPEKIIDLSTTPIVQKLRRDGLGVEIGDGVLEHEESIVAYAAIPDYGWGVITQQTTRASLGLAARDAQLRQLLVGYGLILLLGAITAVLTMRIANTHQKVESDRLLKAQLEQSVNERTAELQVANRELEAFSYSVSHDLRAPLRAIDGFSQVLIEDYADQLDEQGKKYLGRVRLATQRMGYLIDDMLTLSRLTRAEMRRESVDLSAIAAEVLADLQRTDPERKVECRIESGLVAKGDAQLLRVALVNLLGNAWKFTGKTTNPRIEFGVNRSDTGAMEFFVRDNGAGFDMAYAEKLFGVFQRLHPASDFPGTGIGLVTVQRILHRHGGTVRGVGTPDQGATFYFTLTT